MTRWAHRIRSLSPLALANLVAYSLVVLLFGVAVIVVWSQAHEGRRLGSTPSAVPSARISPSQPAVHREAITGPAHPTPPPTAYPRSRRTRTAPPAATTVAASVPVSSPSSGVPAPATTTAPSPEPTPSPTASPTVTAPATSAATDTGSPTAPVTDSVPPTDSPISTP